MNESLVPIRLRKSRALERDEGRIPFETRKKKKKSGKMWKERVGLLDRKLREKKKFEKSIHTCNGQSAHVSICEVFLARG